MESEELMKRIHSKKSFTPNTRMSNNSANLIDQKPVCEEKAPTCVDPYSTKQSKFSSSNNIQKQPDSSNPLNSTIMTENL